MERKERKMSKVFISDTTQGIKKAIYKLLSNIEQQTGTIIKSSKEVYIKPNGIDFKPHCHTSPQVLEAVIEYLNENGAEKVYVMENSTQSNATRLVFEITGYKEVCKKTGAIPLYLDEQKTKTFEFKGKLSIHNDPKGYILKEVRLPKTLVDIMENRESMTYIDLPKLKTHSMAVVTLGIKNQWGFPQHADRGKDHNYNLHSKLVDIYEYIRPDLTIIDGTEGGTIHGHYPPTAFEDELLIPFNLLIGGRDTLSVDVVGARVFGLTLDEVPHLKIAHQRGLGEADLNKIEVIGKDLSKFTKKYEWDLLQKFPEDVKIVKGKELLCREGCQNNPLALLQVLAYDFEDKFEGGFFIIMGKGHDKNLADKLRTEGFTKGLVAGFCAIDEVGEELREEFGKKNVYYSHNCNNLAETATALFRLSGVSALDLVPISSLKAGWLLFLAKLHGSKALTPALF
ncbi:MAG: hypothetical protein BAJALOKI1v1_1730007 [Promethearchaeota archaeon]|nr:MAG: hypothetical protein BAJALOKI1v1_1730007 [Candidatus Lokiarchaeota archaeon]